MFNKLLSSTKFADTLRKLRSKDDVQTNVSEEEIKQLLIELGYDATTAETTAKEFLRSHLGTK